MDSIPEDVQMELQPGRNLRSQSAVNHPCLTPTVTFQDERAVEIQKMKDWAASGRSRGKIKSTAHVLGHWTNADSSIVSDWKKISDPNYEPPAEEAIHEVVTGDAVSLAIKSGSKVIPVDPPVLFVEKRLTMMTKSERGRIEALHLMPELTHRPDAVFVPLRSRSK